jgi:hypothetical protein
MTPNGSHKPVNPNPDYQDQDIAVKPIVYFIIGLTVLTALVVGGMSLFFWKMERQAERADADIPLEMRARNLPPEPRLVVDEKMGLATYLDNARSILDTYGQVDGDTVRIPIEAAIQHVAEHGIKRWSLPEMNEQEGVVDEEKNQE